MEKLLKRFLVPTILFASTAVFLFMYWRLSSMVDDLAQTLLMEKSTEARSRLEGFFAPVKQQILIGQRRGLRGELDNLSLDGFNKEFQTIAEVSKPVSSMMLADELGNEFMLLHFGDRIENRVTTHVGDSLQSIRYSFRILPDSLALEREWGEYKKYDPRTRPWYNAAYQGAQNTIYWTAPYTFFTTRDPGITVSTKWRGSDGRIRVLAYDVMLLDISRFTSEFDVSEHGKLTVFTDDYRVLGLPRDDNYSQEGQLRKEVLKPLDSLGLKDVSEAFKAYTKHATDSYGSFQFRVNGERWWGKVTPYYLENQLLYIQVLAPEKDFMEHIRETQNIIIVVFIAVILITVLLARSLNQKNKLNYLMNKQNRLVEAKNREIMDSIIYAKRIQSAILPPTKIVSNYLHDSFIYYLPKDIVAGDFYWMEKVGDTILFAAADCTGHGVPGALMSVLCHNALNRAVREFHLTEPGEILDKTRELVIEEFNKSEDEVLDGMDIALCALNGLELKFAGANNPVWLVRPWGIEEIKGDRQPIGNFVEPKPYKTHVIELRKGDHFYIFTDGFADQFGGDRGKKYKYNQLRELFLDVSSKPMEKQRDYIADAFMHWKGGLEQVDDVCVIGVKV